MDKNKVSITLSTAVKGKVTTSLFGERAKHAFRTVSLQLVRDLQEVARGLRIIIFLHSSQDFSSS
jgi:hypothetical protein